MNEAGGHDGTHGARAGFTIVELFMVLATVAVLVAISLPVLATKYSRSSRINCAYNMKHLVLAFKTWELDNGDRFPMGVSTNMGGAMEWTSGANLAPQFQVMSNELSTPKILVCPNDGDRPYATNFATLTDENISYFLNVEAVDDTFPSLLLSGDGNITNARLPASRIVKLSPGETIGWNEKVHQRQGFILLCDGSVGQFASGRMPAAKNTARLVVPPPAGAK